MSGRAPICGNCCTDPCTIGTDTFDTDLGQWTTISGTASVSGGSALFSAGDVEIFDPEPADDTVGWRVVLHAQCADSSGQLRVLGCWTDANNHIYGDFSFSGGEGRIVAGQLSGGSDAEITPEETVEDEDAELNGVIEIIICYDPGETIPAVSGVFANYAGEGEGTGWTTPEGVIDPAGAFAEYSAGSMVTTNTLSGTNVGGPLLPAGTTIVGIAVTLLVEHDGMDTDYQDVLVKLLDGSGSAVGDNKATAASLNSFETLLSYGGATDDWNAGLTPTDIASALFGAVFQFQNVGSVGNIRARGMGFDIWYETPDRTPGRLTFSYKNAAAPNTVQCVRNFNVFTDGGLKTGIQVISGDWTFADYELKKLYDASTAPTCPECAECNDDGDVDGCNCCDPDFPAAQEYVVDLGVGGWTNVGASACDECTTVAGPYLVSFFQSEISVAHCTWRYEQLISCTGATADCEPDEYWIAIELTLGLYEPGCRWHAQVALASISEPAVCFRQAFYASDELADLEQCRTMPVTLTKYQPPLNVAIEDGDACGGLLPDTITLDLP